MPPLATSKQLKPIVTYGRPSRSKFSSFRVFQDVIDDERGLGKRAKEHSEEYDQLSVRPLLPTISLGSKFEDENHPINEGEDPFADPSPLLNTRPKPPSLPPKQVKATNPGALRGNEGKENRLSKRALVDKSTNYPVLVRSASTTEGVHSSAAVGLPQPSKSETGPSPKFHQKKKPKLNPQVTPRLVLKAGLPMRPRKPRQAGLPLEDQDSLTILLPSKARKLDYRSHFRKYSEISESGSDRPYNEPHTVLGINGSGVNNGIDIIPGAWVRGKAKEILSGTKRAAEKILGVSPSSARYKNQQQKIRHSKSRRGVAKNLEMSQKLSEGSSEDRSVLGSVVFESESSDGDAMSLQDFLEDPFSSSGDYELGQYTEFEVDRKNYLNGPRPNQVVNNRFWRTESTQDLLVLESAKIQHATITKQLNPKSRIEEDDRSLARNWDSLDSFVTTTNLNPGTAYEFYNLGSDNEMPSSSPVAKSTPKKDWYRCEDSGAAKALDWEPNRQTREKNPRFAKDMIITLGSSDTDHLERTAIRGLLGEGDENGCDGRGWSEGTEEEAKFSTGFNENRIRRSLNEHKEQRGATRLREVKPLSPPVLALGDGFHKDKSDMGILGTDVTKKEKNCYSLEMSIDEVSDSKKDIGTPSIITNTKTKVGDLQEKVISGEKRDSEICSVGGKFGLRGKRRKETKNKAGRIAAIGGDGGSNHAVTSKAVSKKKIIAGGAGKKVIKRRKSSLGYDKVEMNSDIDELQMDLPGMRI